MTAVLAAALAFCDVGVAVVPASTNGSKAPAGPWRVWQHRRAGRPQVREWFANDYPGLGLVTGAVSGNLEMAELEAAAVAEGGLAVLDARARSFGIHPLWQRVLDGYLETSPTGGLHMLYRVDGAPIAGNTKLARRPATDAELAVDPATKIKVLAETRGEGGFVIVAPSNGDTHPSGRPWRLVKGGPQSIPVVTAQDRDQLHILLRTLDAMPVPEPVADTSGSPFAQPGSQAGSDPLSPGNAYAAEVSWARLLEPEGWTRVIANGPVTYWRRPGKRIGISASTGHGGGDWLWVWSTSTAFEAERTYTKFGAYAVLKAGGDHSEAARQLRAGGYGQQGTGTLPPRALPPPAVTAPATPGVLDPPDLDAFLDEPDPERNEVIPGLLDRGERIIVTATEGSGKSTLLRQIAVQVASGIHPFTGKDMEPVQVLLLDLENSRVHVKRKLRDLREAAAGYKPPMLRVKVHPAGLDLMTPEDGDWLLALLAEVQPALFIAGPIYKMVGGEAEKEGPARTLTQYLDRIREDYRCAVILEAHSPYAQNGMRRPTRPYGNSLYSRWPEFGIYLGEDGALSHWRGVREEDRCWPKALKRGDTWPWEADETQEADEDGEKPPFRPTVLMQRVSELLDRASEPMSKNGIAAAVQGKKAYILQAVDLLVAEGYVEIIKGARGTLHQSIKLYDPNRFPVGEPVPDRFPGPLGNRFPAPPSPTGGGTGPGNQSRPVSGSTGSPIFEAAADPLPGTETACPHHRAIPDSQWQCSVSGCPGAGTIDSEDPYE